MEILYCTDYCLTFLAHPPPEITPGSYLPPRRRCHRVSRLRPCRRGPYRVGSSRCSVQMPALLCAPPPSESSAPVTAAAPAPVMWASWTRRRAPASTKRSTTRRPQGLPAADAVAAASALSAAPATSCGCKADETRP